MQIFRHLNLGRFLTFLQADFYRLLRDLPLASKRRLTLASVIAGSVIMLYYYTWWLEPGAALNLYLLPFLSLALVYNTTQVFAAWYIYTRIKLPESCQPLAGLKVDVFIPATI